MITAEKTHNALTQVTSVYFFRNIATFIPRMNNKKKYFIV